jgi:uncharacterized protein YsxB (DUF464 family)
VHYSNFNNLKKNALGSFSFYTQPQTQKENRLALHCTLKKQIYSKKQEETKAMLKKMFLSHKKITSKYSSFTPPTTTNER